MNQLTLAAVIADLSTGRKPFSRRLPDLVERNLDAVAHIVGTLLPDVSPRQRRRLRRLLVDGYDGRTGMAK